MSMAGKSSTADRRKQSTATLRNRELVYTGDHQPGIRRVKKGGQFVYNKNKKRIRDKRTLDRIKALVIPPAWSNVWICLQARGHLQATGRDARGRKQYRYHAAWSASRNREKFTQLLEFGKRLPVLRSRLAKDLSGTRLSQKRVLATVIRLMESTYIRVGGTEYERENNSYGITTMKDRHVTVGREIIQFAFRGKSGVFHNITVRNRRLAGIVKQCREIPGQVLFQYRDREGNARSVDSGTVNNYLKTAMGYPFTSKDMRTWAGTLHALCAMKAADANTGLPAILDIVSEKLGNTRAVCKRYYVHPFLVKLFEENTLSTVLNGGTRKKKHFSAEEQVLMKILAKARKSKN